MELQESFHWYIRGLVAISIIFYAKVKETVFKPLPDRPSRVGLRRLRCCGGSCSW